jgi:hypothetical protein
VSHLRRVFVFAATERSKEIPVILSEAPPSGAQSKDLRLFLSMVRLDDLLQPWT